MPKVFLKRYNMYGKKCCYKRHEGKKRAKAGSFRQKTKKKKKKWDKSMSGISE